MARWLGTADLKDLPLKRQESVLKFDLLIYFVIHFVTILTRLIRNVYLLPLNYC